MAPRLLNEDPWWENSDLTGPAREEPGAAMNIDLNPDGPHSGEHSREVAEVMAQAVRVLCHATIGSAPGLDYASDVDAIVGSLHSAATGMEQLLRQAGAFLARLEADGRLGDDAGEDPAERLRMVRLALDVSAMTVSQLEGQLARAQRETSHMQTLGATDG
jgi:hypothetical protein